MAKKKTQIDKNLFTAISYLQQSIEREDEKKCHGSATYVEKVVWLYSTLQFN
jgi:hypothetical protein